MYDFIIVSEKIGKMPCFKLNGIFSFLNGGADPVLTDSGRKLRSGC